MRLKRKGNRRPSRKRKARAARLNRILSYTSETSDYSYTSSKGSKHRESADDRSRKDGRSTRSESKQQRRSRRSSPPPREHKTRSDRDRKKTDAKDSVDSRPTDSILDNSAIKDSFVSIKYSPARLSFGLPLYEDYESQRGESEPELPLSAREQWNNQLEYILVLVSIAVGLGNVWKFPLEAYNNGGGAFLILYLIVVVVVAMPMYFVEITVSQFCSRGPLGVWDCVPIMRGIGWSAFLISTMLSFFYLVLLAWAALYLYFSFYTEFPWSNCTLSSYTSGGLFKVRTAAALDLVKPKCVNNTFTFQVSYNKTTKEEKRGAMDPELAFFLYHILKSNPNIKKYGLGWPQFEVSLALAILWFIVFLIMMCGTKSTGKVAYFTALFPYAVLIILFVRAVTLPGAKEGILMLLKPNFKHMTEVKVWFRAMNQAFFSLGIGFGNAAVSGSYSPLHQKTYYIAVIVALADTFASILAGFTVFSILGVLAKKRNISLEKVVPSSGGSLSFVAYPMLMGSFGKSPVPNIFAALFFAMILTLGIGSAMGFIQVLEATTLDRIPFLGLKRSYKIVLVAFLTMISFGCGLVFCCPGSEHVINMFDKYGCGFVIFFIVTMEIFAWTYIYGIKNLVADFLFMFPRIRLDWKCAVLRYWAYGMPVFFLAVFLYVAITLDMVEETKVEKFNPPWYLQVAGWVLFGVVAAMVPLDAIWVLLTRKTSSFEKKWMASVHPNRHWGPKAPDEKAAWEHFKKDYEGFGLSGRYTKHKPGVPDKNIEPEKTPEPLAPVEVKTPIQNSEEPGEKVMKQP